MPLRLGVLLVGITLASACGGRDGPLSAVEFRDRVEEQCRDVEERNIAPPSDKEDYERFADEFIGALEEDLAEMRSLEPPPELQERWPEYLGPLDRLVSTMRDLADEIEGAPVAEIPEITASYQSDFREIESRGHEIERELGLDDCVD